MKIGRNLSNSLLRAAIINSALAGFSRPILTVYAPARVLYFGIRRVAFLQFFALFCNAARFFLLERNERQIL
jgi:hypothetical protein